MICRLKHDLGEPYASRVPEADDTDHFIALIDDGPAECSDEDAIFASWIGKRRLKAAGQCNIGYLAQLSLRTTAADRYHLSTRQEEHVIALL
jgi:hypothetical protein